MVELFLKNKNVFFPARLHETMQQLFYFRNVDGSFGEPLAPEDFRSANY
jgi:hypothetical protein